ncbi:MAG: FecR domain-containing protein [Saprospiraceae bacterium]|nr:FecR domain-containing protein [Saprospiraceae bacterium]
MQENDYIVLLHKQLTGEISPAEQLLLSDWINQSADNARFADDLRLAWEKSAGYEKDFQPDLNAAFRQLQARIQTEPLSIPLQVLTFRQRLLRVAAVAAVLIAGLWGYQQFSGAGVVPESVVVSSEKGTKEVLLPDGTRVWLREGASLAYAAAFAGKKRQVKLSGEAYFEVASDSSKVFHVEMQDQKGGVEVLGTSFYVRQNAQETAVTVRTGKVRFTPDANSKSVILAAGEKAVLDKSKKLLTTETVLTFNELAWQTGGLEFIRTPMKQVVSDLEAYYGVQITLSNTSLQYCKHTAPLTNQPLEKVLESLSLTYQMQVKQTGPKEYLLTGGTCQ